MEEVGDVQNSCHLAATPLPHKEEFFLSSFQLAASLGIIGRRVDSISTTRAAATSLLAACRFVA
jgi:hypothetical protein